MHCLCFVHLSYSSTLSNCLQLIYNQNVVMLVIGKLQPEKLSLDLEVVDKAAGTPYIGLNVNLDNNKIENGI